MKSLLLLCTLTFLFYENEKKKYIVVEPVRFIHVIHTLYSRIQSLWRLFAITAVLSNTAVFHFAENKVYRTHFGHTVYLNFARFFYCGCHKTLNFSCSFSPAFKWMHGTFFPIDTSFYRNFKIDHGGWKDRRRVVTIKDWKDRSSYHQLSCSSYYRRWLWRSCSWTHLHFNWRSLLWRGHGQS